MPRPKTDREPLKRMILDVLDARSPLAIPAICQALWRSRDDKDTNGGIVMTPLKVKLALAELRGSGEVFTGFERRIGRRGVFLVPVYATAPIPNVLAEILAP